MRKVFKHIIFCLALLVSGICFAQTVTITPTLIGTTGNYSTAGFGSISSSVGEPMVTTLTNTVSAVSYLTQGFQQTYNCPNVIAVATDSTICQGKSTLLSAIDSMGNPLNSYSFSWSPSAGLTCTNCSNPVATPSATTTYTVFAYGICNDTGVVTIQVSPTMTTTITGPDSICQGNPVTFIDSVFGGLPPYLYSWNTGATTSAITDSTYFSTYSVTTTDAFGCTAAATHSLTVNAVPIVNVSPPNMTICSGNNTTLNVFGANSYLWSPSSGLSCTTCSNPAASPSVSTTYTVIGSNSGGCTNTATVSVTVNQTPTVSITGNNSICSGNSTTLSASASGATYYSWSTGSTATFISVSPTASTGYNVTVSSTSACSATSSFSVTVTQTPPAPSFAAGNSPLCAGDTLNLTADPTLTGTYNWNGPNGFTSTGISTSIPNATTAASGTYSVAVTNGACTGPAATTSVVVNSSPAVTISGNASICFGGSETLAASSSFSGNYLWSTNATTSSITVSPSSQTSYSVTLTNANGCSGTNLFTVNVNSLPNITIGISPSQTICSGSSATLTAAGGNSYVWSNGPSTPMDVVSPTASTSYTVTGTDINGCSNTASDSVFVTTAPTASIVVSPSNSICNGASVTLTASGGSSYSWSNSSTQDSIVVSPTITTLYTATVSIGSCSDTQSVLINVIPFSPQVSGTTSVCAGGTITFSASGGSSYAWSGPNGFTSSLPAPIITNATGANTGTYSVVVSFNSCSAMVTINVSVTPLPTPSIACAPPDSAVCFGSSATLTASGGTTYSWSPGGQTATTITPVILSNVTYTLTAYNNGCSAITTKPITMKPLPNISISSPDSSFTICKGDSLTLNAQGGLGYYWGVEPDGINYGTVPSILVSPSATSTYTVGGQGTNSCFGFASAIVNVSSIDVTATSDNSTICPGFTVQLDASATGDVSSVTYLWMPSSLVHDSASHNTYASLDSTATFIVEANNQDGCWDKDTITIFVVRDASCVIHIYNGITPNSDGHNDEWWIDGIQSFPDNRVAIFNRWGNKLWSASGYNNKDVIWKGKNEKGQDLPDGTYYYSVELFDADGSTLFSAKGWVEITH